MQEVLDHAKFCNESVEKFHGRNDLIDGVNRLFESFACISFSRLWGIRY